MYRSTMNKADQAMYTIN